MYESKTREDEKKNQSLVEIAQKTFDINISNEDLMHSGRDKNKFSLFIVNPV